MEINFFYKNKKEMKAQMSQIRWAQLYQSHTCLSRIQKTLLYKDSLNNERKVCDGWLNFTTNLCSSWSEWEPWAITFGRLEPENADVMKMKMMKAEKRIITKKKN